MPIRNTERHRRPTVTTATGTGGAPAAAQPRGAVALAVLAAFCAAALLIGCSYSDPKQVVATEEGLEISIRPEREPPRPAPGPEFDSISVAKVERSLRRLVIRHTGIILLTWSDPKPLLRREQVETLRDEIFQRLPGLSLDQRLGFVFTDPYKGFEVDVEIYPAGPHLVYEFRKLMQEDVRFASRGAQAINEGEIFPQANQEVDQTTLVTVVRDPINSAARPNLDPLEDEAVKEEEIF